MGKRIARAKVNGYEAELRQARGQREDRWSESRSLSPASCFLCGGAALVAGFVENWLFLPLAVPCFALGVHKLRRISVLKHKLADARRELVDAEDDERAANIAAVRHQTELARERRRAEAQAGGESPTEAPAPERVRLVDPEANAAGD